MDLVLQLLGTRMTRRIARPLVDADWAHLGRALPLPPMLPMCRRSGSPDDVARTLLCAVKPLRLAGDSLTHYHSHRSIATDAVHNYCS